MPSTKMKPSAPALLFIPVAAAGALASLGTSLSWWQGGLASVGVVAAGSVVLRLIGSTAEALEVGTELYLTQERLESIERQLDPESPRGQLEPARAVAQRTITRLERELLSLSTRARVNQVIGLLLGVLGLIAPSVAVLDLAGQDSALSVVRVGVLTLAIEVLAAVFLRLHRVALDEIRCVHNELTNSEARLAALEVGGCGALGETSSALRAILEDLLQTERNPKLAQRPERGPSAAPGGTLAGLAKLIEQAGGFR